MPTTWGPGDIRTWRKRERERAPPRLLLSIGLGCFSTLASYSLCVGGEALEGPLGIRY